MRKHDVLRALGTTVTVSVTTPVNASFRGRPLVQFALTNQDAANTVYWLIETSPDGTYWEPVTDEIPVPPLTSRSWQTDPESLRRYFRDSARTTSGSAVVDSEVLVAS